MKTFSSFLIKNLKHSLLRPFFYILALILVIFSSLTYFFANGFFTSNGNTNLIPFFTNIPFICIILIPCLCFKHSDSLYDDFVPLKTINRLFAKFLSLFIQYAFFLLLVLPIPFFVNLFGNVDNGSVFTSFVCLLLFGASQISLCLLLNECFENNIISLTISVIILLIFNVAHLFFVYVPFNNFLISFFKLLSFSWHFDAASKGIFDTRDISYLIFTSLLFLYIASIVKEHKAGRKKLKTFETLSLLLLILCLLNGQRWYTRFDFSKNKTYSVSNYTKKLLEGTEHNIKITYYRSQNLSKYYPQIRDVQDFLQTYSNSGKNITFSIKDPDNDSQTLSLLQNYGITNHQMQAVKNSQSVEYINVYSAIVIEYEGNVEVIPYILSSQTLEYDLDGRIKHLLTGQTRLVNIIIGNELSIDDSNGYNMVIPWLNSQGFICNYIDLSSENFTSQLEQTFGPLLVIGDSNILIDKAIAIENYVLSNRGNAMFCVSPYSIDFSSWQLHQNQNTNIIEMLENWGLIFTNKIAADTSCSIITMQSVIDENASTYDASNIYTQNVAYPLFINLLPQENSKLGFTQFWTTPLEIIDTHIAKPYLFSTNNAWTYEIERNKSENLLETNPFMLQNEDLSKKERGELILGAFINGELNGLFTASVCQNASVIVIPDQYMLNTSINFGLLNNDYRNFDFLTNCMLLLNNENELAALHSKTSFDTSFYKTTDNFMFEKYKKNITLFFTLVMPLFLITCFVSIQIIHKRIVFNEIK